MVVVSYFLSSTGNLSFLNSILSISGVFFLHLFSNLYNDYFDVKHGTDEANSEYFNVGEKSIVLRGAQISGGSRAIELGLITLKNTKKLANIMLFTSMIFLIMVCYNSYLITNSFSNIKAIGLIALTASLLGYFYTAKPIRLSSRRGLGELTIFLCFGPLLTIGSAIAMSTSTIVLDYQNLRDFIFIGLPLGLLTTNILFINQFPDYNSDKITGKINLVVLLGKKLSRWIFLLNITLTIILTYSLKDVFLSTVSNFNEIVFSVIISILALYGLFISLGLFKNYNKRSLVYFNIQTIYYQIFFCLGIIISFYF
jgi:1,4-dihydroxy-2-naphthoate octaprenyltransferase